MADFKKNGIVNSSYFNEYHIEPDGSVWEPVFRHNNPASQLFSSGDTFSVGVYKNNEMYFNFNVCKEINKFEFLFIQKDTAESTQRKYRWVQTKSPFTSSYADVAPSAVTRITTSEYTDGGYGGYYALNSSTYFVIANSSNGNWFGATGCWTAYNGGIPGYPNTTCTTGEVKAYIRIDGTNQEKQFKMYKSNLATMTDIVEN